MIINLEQLIDEINNAENPLFISKINPAEVSLAVTMEALGKKVIYVTEDKGLREIEKYRDDHDLFVTIGVHNIPKRVFNKYNIIKIDDGINYSNFSDYSRTYQVSLKSYPPSETFSYAHLGYLLAKEFNLELSNLHLWLYLIGNRDDLREVGTTKFDEMLMEEMNGSSRKVTYSPFGIKKMKEYSIFNIPHICHFFDFTDGEPITVNDFFSKYDVANIEHLLWYVVTNGKLDKKINSTLGLDVARKHRLVYAPTYNGFNVDEALAAFNYFLKKVFEPSISKHLLKKSFLSLLKNYLPYAVSTYLSGILSDVQLYNNGNYRLRVLNDTKYGERLYLFEINHVDGPFGSKMNLLPFMPYNSIVVEFSHRDNGVPLTPTFVHSKSNWHVGVLLMIASGMKRGDEAPIFGDGERFKGYLLTVGESDSKLIRYALKDIFSIDDRTWKYRSRAHNFCLYRTFAEGWNCMLRNGEEVRLYEGYKSITFNPSEDEINKFAKEVKPYYLLDVAQKKFIKIK